ncbi:MAG: hypothetical protein AAGI52_11935 [Bacteroidota bacterium]
MLATVDPAVAGVVAYVDAIRDEMRALWPVPGPVMARAMRRFRADWAAHSARLAGSALTPPEARALLLFDRVAPAHPFEAHDTVRRHALATQSLETLAEADDPLLGPTARALRACLAPSASDVAPPVLELPRSVHPIARSADALVQLTRAWQGVEAAAPTARLLASLVLMRAGYLPVLFREERAADGRDALAEALDNHEAPLVRYVAEELAATMERFLYLLREGDDAFGERVDALAGRVQTARETRGFGATSPLAPFVDEVLLPLDAAVSEAVEAFCPRLFAACRSRGAVRLASGIHIRGGIRAFRETAWTPSLRRYTGRWTLTRHALAPRAEVHIQMRAEIDGDRFRVSFSSAGGPVGSLDGRLQHLPGEGALREAMDAVRARLVTEVEAIGSSGSNRR